jgi:hypothetical protein
MVPLRRRKHDFKRIAQSPIRDGSFDSFELKMEHGRQYKSVVTNAGSE